MTERTTEEPLDDRPFVDDLDDGELAAARRRGWPLALGSLVVGLVLAMLVFLDPFHLHGLDERMRGEAPTEAVPEGAPEDTPLWTCGMHPQVISEEPGSCPICGMDLTPRAAGAAETVRGHEGHDHDLGQGGVTDLWTCPMHPQILEEAPGSCPICGMDLVRKPVERAAGGAEGPSVHLDPGVVQTMNVRTATVERRDLERQIRTVGYLEYDQQRMVTVTTKYEGFVEKVHVHYVGEPVRRGQPLFEVYSPELVQTQEELVSALAFARRLEGQPEEARGRAEALVAAARTRLGYWDIGRDQIARLEETGQAVRTLTVRAPASGLVMKRMPGLEGMAVRPGMELFHIADLSSLWLSVEVFEDQLSWLREGSRAEVTLSYFPGEVFHGTVRFVEPQVAEATRTVGLRIEIPNPEGKLRAGMYATVAFTPVVAPGAVTVPSLAVLRTGERDVVIVAEGEGRFTPRQVRLGVEGGEYVQVLSGLEAGEEVVTSSQFLIDSESNLREAIQKLLGRRGGEA